MQQYGRQHGWYDVISAWFEATALFFLICIVYLIASLKHCTTTYGYQWSEFKTFSRFLNALIQLHRKLPRDISHYSAQPSSGFNVYNFCTM